ncbi:MAG: hypothetical protein AAFP26_05620 [Planctomycetota bacterium]
MPQRPSTVMAVLVCVTVLACSACTTAPRTTRHTAADLLEASDTLRDSLARSAWLAGRGPSSPPYRLGLGETVNRSADRLSQSARRVVLARTLLGEGMLDLFDARGVAVVLPPADAQELARFGVDEASHVGAYERPSHVAQATFSSLTRVASLGGGPADARRDTFLVELTIIDADSRAVVFTDRFEYARVAAGRLFD